jgi:hypothetical protein
MKRLNREFKFFNLCFFLVIFNAAFAKEIALESGNSKVDYAALEKLSSNRGDVFKFDGADSFKVTLGGRNIYFLASSVIISNDKLPNGSAVRRGHCEFDFYDAKYEYVNGIRVNVRDYADTNVCNWIEGVSAVTYKNQPALLVTVQYHRGIDPAKTVNEIGNNYHDFTALLALDPHPDGSLSVHQDDSCLGPMNQIGELAIARKRITECNR